MVSGRRPTVSVIVPCYRYGHYVVSCVDSVLRNQEVDVDVVVLDDASPDDSWEVVRRLPERDSRVRVHRNEQNTGLIGTVNRGLDMIDGEYVVVLSADDALAPGWLDRGVAALERSPGAAFALGPVRIFEGRLLPPPRRGPAPDAVLHDGRAWLSACCEAGGTPVHSPEVIVRTSAQRRVGGYSADVPFSSDMEMWLRLASIGDVVQVAGPTAAFYRVHPSNMSRAPELKWLGELEINLAAFDAWLARSAPDLDDPDGLRATARRALARRAVGKAPAAFLFAPAMFEELCAFACANDPAGAAEPVRRLRERFSGGALRAGRDAVLPVARGAMRIRQSVPQLRARLESYSTRLTGPGASPPRAVEASAPGIWCCELELAAGPEVRSVDARRPGQDVARVLVRLHGDPLGYVRAPAPAGAIDLDLLTADVWQRWADTINDHLVLDGLAKMERLSAADLPPAAPSPGCPSRATYDDAVSVVVCTRNRAASLERTLASIGRLTHGRFEVVVVDNAPSDSSTRDLLRRLSREDHRLRYVCEPRPGLSYARNRGLAEASGRMIAYTDDDVTVDAGWLQGLLRGLHRRDDVGCVTGLVCTASVSTPSEAYFDARAHSWSTRCEPRLFDLGADKLSDPLYPYSAGVFGTGANFAFDRAFLAGIGGFDVELGAGTPTNGSEDLDVFVNTLLGGRAIAYEPAAVVWHYHRADATVLRKYMFGGGIGLGAFITKLLVQRRTRWQVARRIPVGVWKMARIPSDVKQALVDEMPAPRGATAMEFLGYAAGPAFYLLAKRNRRRIARRHADST